MNNFQKFTQKILKEKPHILENIAKLQFDSEFNITEEIINLRIRKGLTQTQLADLIETKQPAIARIEKGSVMPRINLLYKIATAVNAKLLIKFIFSEDESGNTVTNHYKIEAQPTLEIVKTYVPFPIVNKYHS